MGKKAVRSSFTRAVASGTLACATAALSGACSQQDNPRGELVLFERQSVQSSYVGWTETTSGRGVDLVKAWAPGKKARSVGAIRPAGENWPGTDGDREATCGATFISKHHAVTASHCVPTNNLPSVWPSTASPFRVQQVDTTNLNLTEAADQTYVTGTWPNYNRVDTLTAAEGYAPTTNTCYVKIRCDSTTGFGRDNCPASFGTTIVDIALIYCPNKTTTEWARVATADSGTGNIEVWWYHEVVYLATDINFPPYQPSGNFDHYFLYTPTADGRSNNYHYRNDLQEHQVLPLVSWRDSTNALYKSVEPTDNGDQYTDANVPICHGTSGSGVFVAGNWNDTDPRLLGPAIHGDTWTGSHLCNDMFAASGGNRHFDYVKRIHTARIEAVADVLNDR